MGFSMYSAALSEQRFDQAKRRALVERVMSLITGKSDALLSFDEVREKLGAWQQLGQETKVIPLDRIVGSVGRYRDFTRAFLPLEGASKQRWKSIDAALNNMEILPPIEVFQVGDVYFVRDGNHRVSVARANGLTHIEAHVIKIDTPVPLEPDVQPDDLIRKAEYADFLDETHLDEILPQVRIELTEPGRYKQLLEHIRVHRYFLGLEQKREISWKAAVKSWYEKVYLPVVGAIHESGILNEFPQRTEADLYLWVAHHREELQKRYKLPGIPSLETAVATFAEMHSEVPLRKVVKAVRRAVQEALGEDTIEEKVLGKKPDDEEEFPPIPMLV
ncbi:MAG: hypothetical protein IT330_03345 [Anaerolineae bacterium]|nr:hypothetical protein [Anaerolineae bacterium]